MPLRIPNPINVTTQPAAALQSALGTLAFGGPSPYQVEAQNAQEAQRLAHAMLYQEQTGKAAAERALLERQGQLRSEAGMDETTAAMAGVPVSGIRTYRDWLRGTPGVSTMPPAGPALDAIRRADAALRTGMADGTVNSSEIARAQGLYGEQGIRDRAAAGEVPMDQAAALLRLGHESPFAEWGSKFTSAPSEFGTARTLSENAQADQRTAAAGRERAHAGLYGAQADGERQLNRAGVGGRFGPPVIVNDPEAGPVYTAPGAATGRTPAARPLDPATAAMRDAAANLSDVRAAAGGFAPRAGAGAGRTAAPRRITANDRTLLDNAIKQTLAEMNVGSLDEATQNAILAAAEGEWQKGAAGHQTAAMAAINAVAPQGFEDGRAGIPLVPSKFRAKGGPQAQPPAAGGPAPAAAPTGAPAATAAVPPPAQRVPGQTYNTPRGPMKWTGTGWVPAGA